MSQSPINDSSSLPVDPHPDEWILKDPMPPAASATGRTSATTTTVVPSSSRLDALEKRGYEFPPLPAMIGSGHANGDEDVSWSYGTSSLARKKKAEMSAKQKLQQQQEAQADNRAASSNTNTIPPAAAAAPSSSSTPLPPSFASKPSSKPRVHFRGGGSDVESDEDEETEGEGQSMNHDDDNTEERKSTGGESEDVEMGTSAASSQQHLRQQQQQQQQQKKKKKARIEPLGDDPLYGAELDDEDQQWLHEHHSSHHLHSPSASAASSNQSNRSVASAPSSVATPSSSQGPARSHARGGPRTDAFLSCPACFTPVCVDCQRHATRPNNFRAMFVLNDLIVDKGRTVPPQPGTSLEKGEKYVAVLCKVCKTHVGVLDQDEVYHFYNVLESQA